MTTAVVILGKLQPDFLSETQFVIALSVQNALGVHSAHAEGLVIDSDSSVWLVQSSHRFCQCVLE